MSRRTAGGDTRSSMVETVGAKDGSSFDMLEGASEGAAESRGDALVEMKKIVEQEDPSLLKHLKTGQGTSAEYAMSSVIMFAKNPELKAKLVRIAVGERLAEKHRHSAVEILGNANAAQLSLDDMGESWIDKQYDTALQEGDYSDAWGIAKKLAGEDRTKTIKPDTTAPDAEQRKQAQWKKREIESFKLYVEESLRQMEQKSGDSSTTKLDILLQCAKSYDRKGVDSLKELIERMDAAKKEIEEKSTPSLLRRIRQRIAGISGTGK